MPLDGLPPFLVERPLGVFKFVFDPRLLLLQMGGGFFEAEFKQPPRLGQFAGNGRWPAAPPRVRRKNE